MNEEFVEGPSLRHHGTGRTAYCTVPCFNHLDFVYGPDKEVKEDVYNVILNWFDSTFNIDKDCPSEDEFKRRELRCNKNWKRT